MSHGPGMHGPVVMALFLIVLIGAIVYGLFYLAKRRKRGARDASESDRGPER